MLRAAIVTAAVFASASASAATMYFNNGSGTYTADGVTATVTVTVNRSQDGLYYNGVEDAIGVGNSATTGAMGYSNYSFPIGNYVENETITVAFDQEVTIDRVWLRQWEDNFLGFGDEVIFTSDGGNTLFDKSDGVVGLLDKFDTGITLNAFTLTPEQDGKNGAGANNRTAVYLHSVDFTVSEVPLPAAAYLFGSALAGLVAVGRRRRAVNA